MTQISTKYLMVVQFIRQNVGNSGCLTDGAGDKSSWSSGRDGASQYKHKKDPYSSAAWVKMMLCILYCDGHVQIRYGIVFCFCFFTSLHVFELQAKDTDYYVDSEDQADRRKRSGQ